MSDVYYPTLPGLAFPVKRRAIWQNVPFRSTASGREYGVSSETYPRWRWDLTYEFLRSLSATEMQTLAAFFNARRGQADTFLFTDPDGSAVTAEQFGTGDGTTTDFPLTRLLGSFTEPVGYAVPTQVTVNGTPSGAYTLIANRIVRFSAAPAGAAVLRWSGTYAYRCRFLDPEMTLSKFLAGYWSADISIITVKA